MIVGSDGTFAIESEVSTVCDSDGLLAIGFFIIHVGGKEFGVRAPDASALALSLAGVEGRIAARGQHVAPFDATLDGLEIARAYLNANYSMDDDLPDFHHMTMAELSRALHESGIIWAPDGDEAFDDGSHVLQLDVDDKVRVIAFTNTDDPEEMPATLSDRWLDANMFYDVLDRWQRAFTQEVEARRADEI